MKRSFRLDDKDIREALERYVRQAQGLDDNVVLSCHIHHTADDRTNTPIYYATIDEGNNATS